MDANRKKLIQLRTKLEFYNKLDKKIEQVMNCEIELDAWQERVYNKIQKLEIELDNLKFEMNLSDTEWNEDEQND